MLTQERFAAVTVLQVGRERGGSQTRASGPGAGCVHVSSRRGRGKARSTQTQDEQIKAIRQACTLDDFMAHCSWIQPSSPEVVLCLKANAAGLSPSCRAAIASRSDTPPPSLPADIGRKEQTTPEPRKPEPAHASPLVSSQTGMLRKPAEKRNPSGLPL